MAQTYWVTPTLLLGRIPADISKAARAESPDEALQLIIGGQTAVLPANAWDMAERVLRELGLGEEAITDRIVFARTGSTG
jgi:hypothetical protein